MTFQLIRDLQRLRSENQRLQSEIQRLRAENQAAKGREEQYRNELQTIKKEIADRGRRDEERLEQLMLNGVACGLFFIVCCRSDQR
jgi:prefoldin subunit 5